jgi:hypothetical protein
MNKQGTARSGRKFGAFVLSSVAIVAASATAIAGEPVNNNYPKVNNLPNGDMQILGGYGGNAVTGSISTSTDKDYIFLGCATNTVIGAVTLSGLSADLDIFVYDFAAGQVGSSAAGGSSDEYILDLNLSVNTSALVVEIRGWNSATSNYTLNLSCVP